MYTLQIVTCKRVYTHHIGRSWSEYTALPVRHTQDNMTTPYTYLLLSHGTYKSDPLNRLRPWKLLQAMQKNPSTTVGLWSVQRSVICTDICDLYRDISCCTPATLVCVTSTVTYPIIWSVRHLTHMSGTLEAKTSTGKQKTHLRVGSLIRQSPLPQAVLRCLHVILLPVSPPPLVLEKTKTKSKAKPKVLPKGCFILITEYQVRVL